jgi:Tol biopolymer transport system component
MQEPRQEIVWSPQGDALAVLAEDGSLWWIPDPAVDRVEQLTPPLPNVRDVRWSPSGDQIAFVSEADIYIVRVIQN